MHDSSSISTGGRIASCSDGVPVTKSSSLTHASVGDSGVLVPFHKLSNGAAGIEAAMPDGWVCCLCRR